MEKTFEEKFAEAKSAVPALSPEQAKNFINDQPVTLIIDTRSEQDIKATTGFIPGARSIPLQMLGNTELPSQSQRIITACQGGPMGALAAHALKKRGYENVAFIESGTQGWIDAGYATV